MLPLRYRGDVAGDLVRVDESMHRVLGPDTARGYVLVAATEYDPTADRTTAWCRPLPLEGLLGGVRDPHGQWWLSSEAIHAGAAAG